MTANAADFGSATLNAFARALGLLALTVGVALALVFAFAAALVVGVMIAGAALAMRLMPRRTERAAPPGILNAQRTPSGWVVETGPQRKA